MQEASHPRNVIDPAWLQAGLVLGLVALDRWTKIYFLRFEGDRALVPGFLDLTRHENPGIIGDLPLPLWLILLLTFLVSGIVLKKIIRLRKEGAWKGMVALSFILSGAIGNLWDRLQWGYVFDWILLFGVSVINLADIFILSGAVGFLLVMRSKNTTYPLDNRP